MTQSSESVRPSALSVAFLFSITARNSLKEKKTKKIPPRILKVLLQRRAPLARDCREPSELEQADSLSSGEQLQPDLQSLHVARVQGRFRSIPVVLIEFESC